MKLPIGSFGFGAPALALAVLAGPAGATDDCPGTPGYVLSLPETVNLGESFLTCLEAPPGSLAFILIAGSGGPTPTKFGPLCIGLPLITVWPVVIPAEGSVCLAHNVDCDYRVDGMTGWFQAVVLGPGAGQVGLTNGQTLTAVDTGKCIPPGDYYTYTQGGWGTKCSGNNPGCFRDANFPTAFPDGLVLGDPDGDDADSHFAIVFTSSKGIEDFLPSGSTAGALDQDHVNPADKTSAGVLAGQLTAAKLSVGFDDAGSFDGLKGQTAGKLGDLLYTGGVHDALIGQSVRDVIELSDRAISGELAEPFDVDGDLIGDVMFSDLSTALAVLNENFDNGSVNNGNLKLP
jgi:hypothetical protein